MLPNSTHQGVKSRIYSRHVVDPYGTICENNFSNQNGQMITLFLKTQCYYTFCLGKYLVILRNPLQCRFTRLENFLSFRVFQKDFLHTYLLDT